MYVAHTRQEGHVWNNTDPLVNRPFHLSVWIEGHAAKGEVSEAVHREASLHNDRDGIEMCAYCPFWNEAERRLL
jgi:hypothetical protein